MEETNVESAPQNHARTTSNGSTNPPNPTRRLGIRSLGWHAHEEIMPANLLARLQAGEAMIIPNMIPLLGRLSAQDPSVQSTYLCHPSVAYITKLPHEGSFCGYRNIQMLILFLLGQESTSEYMPEAHSQVFASGIPSIPQIQDLIEDAWDRGFNTSGRVETGGIRGTRKHIGTPEVQALFSSLDFGCQIRRFESTNGDSAFASLLAYVEEHFKSETSPRITSRSVASEVYQTALPPIYLQRPRHSLTIIGLEIARDGKRKLLVLDPGYRPSPRMIRAAQVDGEAALFEKRVSLTPYRKGKWQLGGYKEFETVTFVPGGRKG